MADPYRWFTGGEVQVCTRLELRQAIHILAETDDMTASASQAQIVSLKEEHSLQWTDGNPFRSFSTRVLNPVL